MKGVNKINLVFFSSFLISFAYGVLLTIPLFFTQHLSMPVSFSGKIIAMGVLGVFPAIALLPRLYQYVSNQKLISGGCFIYALAIMLVLYGNTFSYYLAGVLFGVGWGVVYTLGPIIISQLSNDQNRTNNFSYISAFNMLGAGLSPVLVKFSMSYGFSIVTSYSAALLSALLAGLTFCFCRAPASATPHHAANTHLSLKTVVTTKAVTPMIMVFLGACIFSSMMNFQSLIADARNLDFSYFYIAYTVSVIVARLTLTKLVNAFAKELMMVLLLAIMALAIALMNFVNGNVFYLIPSALLGLSYGLVYPLIQSASVSQATTENDRKNNLTLFSLCYFIGVYAFPYLFAVTIANANYQYALSLLIFIAIVEWLLAVLLLRKAH
ncbi:MFS transporter [Serratia microhaemolytica]|uniref:MFS transporter n=1 Tax=Serratia microhaemolytica TaxID=2675110 RepID=UPI000FDD5DC7|nr:MFS transporter [Serratia microhaemolytica]